MRLVWLLVCAVVIVACVFGAVETQIRPRVIRDLHADVVWSRDAPNAPEAKTTRAYRWYPLSYPVLERWSFSDDFTLANYASKTIEHFGGPLARHWLDTAIDRDPPAGSLVPDNGPLSDFGSFAKAVGLDDAAGRRRAARRAVSHLASESQDDLMFDQQLLAQLGADAVPVLANWAGNTDTKRLLRADAALPQSEALATAPPEIRKTADRIRMRAGAEYRRELAAEVASESQTNSRDRRIVDAVDRLNAGDTRALPVLAPLLDGDLRHLPQALGFPEMIAVAEAFPNSRYTRACKAYDRLRGGLYFGRDDVEGPDLPKGTAAEWRAWLATYPDHPGADDASYWLGRTLQRDGRRVDALEAYAGAIEHRAGDGDMLSALWNRATFMLDVDMSDDDLAAFARRFPESGFAAFARYALAVRHARAHDFRNAIAVAGRSNLEGALASGKYPAYLFDAKAVGAAYRDQLERWHVLERSTRSGASADAEDALASAWNKDDGWKIGYLVLFDGDRHGGPILDNSPDLAWSGLARQSQLANQNAQVIALAQPLTSGGVPDEMRKRNLRRVVLALYREQNAFPDAETAEMGSLPSFSDGGMWPRELDAATQRYVRLYPQDPFDQTALIATYQVTNDRALLAQLLAAFPNGDRAEEAKALAWHG